MKRSASDPFLEHIATPYVARLRVLNVPVRVESNRRWLVRLAQQAFDDYGVGVMAATEPLRLRLIANTDLAAGSLKQPPPVRVWSDGALLLASMSAADIGVCSYQAGRAMITVSPAMAQFPYHVRYELIEFILYQLARRTLGAIGVHAACVAYNDHSCLLLGESGAGKSTLAYACLTRGWRFLSEDGAFIFTDPCSGKTTIRGMPNFIHLTEDARAFFPSAQASLGATWITRRSGRRKLEIDVRRAFPAAPLGEAALGCLIFLSRQRSALPVLQMLTVGQVRQRLVALQPFAAGQGNWPELLPRLLARPAYLLDTGSDPRAAVALLESALTR